jgi:hypothetical protein
MTMLADGWVWREAKSGLHIRFSMGCSCFFIYRRWKYKKRGERAQHAIKDDLLLTHLYAIFCRKSLSSGISRTVDPNQASLLKTQVDSLITSCKFSMLTVCSKNDTLSGIWQSVNTYFFATSCYSLFESHWNRRKSIQFKPPIVHTKCQHT